VADLPLAKGLADAVHVLGGVDRRVVLQQRVLSCTRPRTIAAVAVRLVLPEAQQLPGGRCVVGTWPGEVIRVTCQGRLARAHAARIKPGPVLVAGGPRVGPPGERG